MGSSLFSCLHRRKQDKTPENYSAASEDINLRTSQIMQHSVPNISTPNSYTQHITQTPESAQQARRVIPNKGKAKARRTQSTTTNNPISLPIAYQKTQHKGKNIPSIQDHLNDLEYNYDNHDELVRQYREELLAQREINNELEQYRATVLAPQGRQVPNAQIPDSFYAPTAVPTSYYTPNAQKTQTQQAPVARQCVLEKDEEQKAIWRAGHTYG